MPFAVEEISLIKSIIPSYWPDLIAVTNSLLVIKSNKPCSFVSPLTTFLARSTSEPATNSVISEAK